MSNNNRDVNFTIRAKNEANREFKSLTTALEELKKTSADVVDGTDGISDGMSDLGKEVKKLSTELLALNALDKVAASIDKVANVVSRAEKAVADGADEFNKYQQELAAMQGVTASLSGETAKLGAALEAEQRKTSELKAAQTLANAEKAKAVRAYQRVTEQISATDKASEKLIKSEAEKAERLKATSVAAEAAQKAYQEQKAAQDAAQRAVTENTKAIRAAQAQETKLADTMERTNAGNLEKQATLTKVTAALTEMKTEAAQVASMLGNVAVSQEDVAKASQKAAATLDAAATELEAMQRFSDGAGGFTDPKTAATLRKQREEVEKARQAWQTLEGQTSRMRAADLAATGSKNQLSAATRQSAAAAAAARNEYRQQVHALNSMATAMGKVKSTGNIFGNMETESRKAMSVMQRLRGEVLLLVTANLGLYAGMQNVGGVVTAYQNLEAAQNRLGAAFRQNGDAVTRELSWLERQADRLGIAFNTLSGNYSKFGVASAQANFQASSTRKIFLGVAEAGRVNKLSMEKMAGVFTALEQIISKGKFSAEEVRQQMGEHLPGAFNILADALGMTTAELDKAMEAGEVLATESNLLKFATALERAFGSQLAKSLNSTTTLIGRFQNNINQAQLRVAEGGFIEGLNEALREMDEWFKSREGRDFFLSMGSALGKLMELLAQVPQYFSTIGTVIQGLISLKVGRWAKDAAEGFLKVAATARTQYAELAKSAAEQKGLATATAQGNAASTTFRGTLATLVTQLRATGAAAVVMATETKVMAAGLTTAHGRTVAMASASTALTGILRGVGPALIIVGRGIQVIVSALGGWVGIIITAVTTIGSLIIGDWLGGIDDTTAAIDEHKRIMGEVQAAYDKVRGTTKAWADELKNVSLIQLDQTVQKLREALAEAKDDLPGFMSLPVGNVLLNFGEDAGKLKSLLKAMDQGDITAQKFKGSLEELYKATKDDAVKELISDIIETAEKAAALEQKLGTTAEAARAMGSDIEGLEEDMERGGVTIAEFGEAADGVNQILSEAPGHLDAYTSAMERMAKFIPTLAAELKKLKDISEIDAAYNDAVANAAGDPIKMANAAYRRDQAMKVILDADSQKMLSDIASGTKVTKDMFADIFGEENFRNKAYQDVGGKWTIGYGSTLLNGQPVQSGQYITQEQGMRQAVSDLNRIATMIESQAKVPLSPEMLRALTSYAYNAGDASLRRDGIMQTLNTGDYAATAQAIRNGVNTVNGVPNAVLKKRRGREADLFASGIGDPALQGQIVENEQKITEEKIKQNELTQTAIADREFELQQGQMIADGKGREAAMMQAEREARKQNKDITEEQIAKVRELAAKQYDVAHASDAVKAAEQKVNDLLQLRKELMEQLETAKASGDTSKITEIETRLSAVNTEYMAAIENAKKLYAEMGGPGAELAIAKLTNAANAVKNVGKVSQITGDQINNMLLDGIMNAFDEFAQAVANGENAVEALGRAFQKMAAQFLIDIGKMILRQAILNMLQGFMGGGGIPMMHGGGVVGSDNAGYSFVSPALFNNAVRYHDGGVAGLKPGEIPTILERGEVVDPGDGSVFSKMFGGNQAPPVVKVVNAFDASDMLSQGLATAPGEQAFMNFVRTNSSGINELLGKS